MCQVTSKCCKATQCWGGCDVGGQVGMGMGMGMAWHGMARQDACHSVP